MLVLSRKIDEKIIIGKGRDQIEITILRIQGDKVSIGIKADREKFPVYRHELLDNDQAVESHAEALSNMNEI